MPREEFVVRITPKGEILIEVDGMPIRQVKDLMSYMEETLGPARQLDPEGPGDEGAVRLEEVSGLESLSSEEQHTRGRIRAGDGE